MSRFYFDFAQGILQERDSAGVELDNVEQAYLEAFSAAQDMWSELLKQRHDPRQCSFEVRGETGGCLFVLPFQEVLESCNDGRRAGAFWTNLRGDTERS